MLPVDFCPCSDNDVAAYFRSSESNQVGLVTHSMRDVGHSYELVGQSRNNARCADASGDRFYGISLLKTVDLA
jgi:hypothetical protein